MYRREKTFINPEFVVENFGDGSESVRGAGGVGNDVVFLRVVFIVVDAEDYGNIFVLRGSRNNNFLRAARFDVRLCFGRVGEKASRLDHDVHAHVLPLDGGGIFLGSDLDGFTVNNQVAVFHFNRAGILPIG